MRWQRVGRDLQTEQQHLLLYIMFLVYVLPKRALYYAFKRRKTLVTF